MAANQFKPQGLVPVNYGAATKWNGQMDSNYVIANGYNNNIFVGDLVTISNTSPNQIISLADLGTPTLQTSQAIGVFMGCNYVPPQGQSAIKAPQGHRYWTAGTRTADGAPAQALVITDPFVYYSIQTGGANATYVTPFLAQQKWGKVLFQYVSGSIVDGNFEDGSSKMYVDFNLATGQTAYNLKSWRADPNTNSDATPYNNIICTLALNAWFAPSLLVQGV